MKNVTSPLVVLLVAFLQACNFSAGTEKDFGTGLSVNYNGFSVEEKYLVNADNQPMSDNKVDLNTTVAIVLQGISNYELKDGKAFPGMSLNVVDKDGNAVLNNDDLFADSEGFSPEDAAILRGTITIGNPMKSGEQYHVKMNVWDKNKPDNTIAAEVDIEVK